MEVHRGRLIDHLHLKVKDLEASKRFYKAAMEALGVPLVEGEGQTTRVVIADRRLHGEDRRYVGALRPGWWPGRPEQPRGRR